MFGNVAGRLAIELSVTSYLCPPRGMSYGGWKMLSPRGKARLGLGSACLLLLCSVAVLHTGATEARRAMRAQPSTAAPEFTLISAAGTPVTLSEHRGAVVVLYFSSIKCPVSNAYDARMAAFGRRWASDPRIHVLQVNSSTAATTPDAELARLAVAAQTRAAGLNCCSLVDSTAAVAKLYAVERTPTFLVIDPSGIIRYRGSFDDNQDAAQARNQWVQSAMVSVLHNMSVEVPVTPAIGCTIR